MAMGKCYIRSSKYMSRVWGLSISGKSITVMQFFWWYKKARDRHFAQMLQVGDIGRKGRGQGCLL